jgi:hypothetical protein
LSVLVRRGFPMRVAQDDKLSTVTPLQKNPGRLG